MSRSQALLAIYVSGGLKRLTRWLTRNAGNAVSKDEALEVARAACKARGLGWREPVTITRYVGDWVVLTDADKRGGNIRLLVDGDTGAVKRVWGPSRA